MRLGWIAAFVGTAAILSLLSGCGGSSSASFNATPQIGCVTGTVPQCGIFPTAVTAGSQTFTLFINGANLIPQTQAMWNGSPRPTVFDETTNLIQMTVFAVDVAQAGTANITVVNPEPSGPPSGSNAVSLQIEPAAGGAPAISASSPFAPANANAGGAAFTLAISGSNFAAGDDVTWNGQTLQPSQIAATQIQVSIPAANIAACGFASIAVSSVAGDSSPSVNFTIQGSCVPAITSISPTSTPQGTVPSSLAVNGSNFTKSSVALLNGSPRATTYVSAAQLTAKPVASDVASVGTVTVTVANPGGGISPSVPSPSGSPVNVLTVSPPGMARIARSPIFAASVPAQNAPRAENASNTAGTASPFPFLISVTPSGQPANGLNGSPAVSADGRFIAFYSSDRDLAAQGPAANYFVRDTCLGVANCTPRTVAVDVSLDGASANGSSGDQLAMSSDGRFVAFVSSATNLVPSGGTANASQNVYVRDLCEGPNVPPVCVPHTTLVSADPTGAPSSESNLAPSISADGRFVAFVQGVGTGKDIVLMRDTCGGASAPRNCVPKTIEAPTGGNSPAISADGTYVTFLTSAASAAPMLWRTCVNSSSSSSCSSATVPVSVAADGSPLSVADAPSISADGRFVVFTASLGSAGPQPNQPPEVFLRDTCIGNSAPSNCQPSTVEIAPDVPSSVNVSVGSTSISASGRFISFVEETTQHPGGVIMFADGTLYVRDTCFGAAAGCVPKTTTVPLGSEASAPNVFSAVPLTPDGRFVAFESGLPVAQDIWLAPTGF